MHFKEYDFSRLPFSSLFNTYTGNFDELSSFYGANPFDEEDVKAHAASLEFKGNREQSANLLKEFNSQFKADEAALKNIEKLRNPDTLALVTGQQLGVYGGPLFTFFKTLAALHLADTLEKQLGRPVVPVFWLADEDHDFDEVRRLSVLNSDGAKTFSLDPKKDSLPPVSDIEIPGQIEDLREDLRSTLIDTDFSDDLWKLLDDCFREDNTFRDAFGSFIAKLFSKHGLVLAGSHHSEIKKQLKEPMITAVKQADEVRRSLEKQSEKIASKFHQQATIYDSHLFYIHPEEGRIKILHEDNCWATETGQEWSTDELVQEIESCPRLFSPDVFLRPILQDRLLPTIGYVAGPGELAYYGQMKTFYTHFDQQMPVIYPRLSATFIEPAIDRIIHELPFEIHEYNNRIEDLESDFVEQKSQLDVEALFDEWKTETKEISTSYIEKVVSVDETLKGAAESATSAYFNALNQLKGKTYRAIKKHEEIQLNRIKRLQQNLFPDRNLQERTLAGIYYMNKFGIDIWDCLLESMEEEEVSFDSHTLIYI